jgi:hypothetical protein
MHPYLYNYLKRDAYFTRFGPELLDSRASLQNKHRMRPLSVLKMLKKNVWKLVKASIPRF